MKEIKICNGLILNNNKILLVKNTDSKELNGYFELPSSKKKIHETERECLIRGIKEKTGLKSLSVIREVFSLKFKMQFSTFYQNTLYLCSADIQQPLNKNAEWFSIEELSNLKLTPYTEEIFSLILHKVKK